MKLLHYLLLISILASLLALYPAQVQAQEGQETPPIQVTPPAQETATPGTAGEGQPGVPQVHVVQEGENLTSIAAQYDISVQELQLVNGLDEDDIIFPGQQLTIPGATGDVVATTYTVQAGDTLASVAARFNTTEAAIAEANRLVSGDNLYAGQVLSIVSRTGTADSQPITGTLHYVQPGETLLMVAARYGVTTDIITELNDLSRPARIFPGMRLRLPNLLPPDVEPEQFHFLPGSWQAIELGPMPVRQGHSISIYVENVLEGNPSGQFAGQELNFAPYEEGYVALVGLDALTEPGLYTLTLTGSGSGEEWWPFEQEVQVSSSNFMTQTVNVPEELAPLLAPEVRAEEDEFLGTFYSQFTPEKRWDGLFQTPVTNTVVTAPYGDLRSYNGGPFDIFHSGVDYGGSTGTPIMAPAAGTIVYTGTVDLRGNTVIVDHGLGVHSGYYHLSEIEVNVGDSVEPGQVIGFGGSTGLSTGPHLHWELRIHDVPVNGQQWTEVPFP
jgi:murein DD-endopeptidase MepM/ murein hydrolase activator NlpD